MKIKGLVPWIFVFYSCLLSAQVYRVSGVVRDSLSQAPLAFVSVGIAGQAKGTMTDIDGKFSLFSEKAFTELQLNYVGYRSKRVPCEKQNPLLIYLSQNRVVLNEVVVVAGENPANRIIKKAVERKEQNNPENLSSFSYECYNKFIYTVGDIKKHRRDTIDSAFSRFIETSNLFMMESVTERKFKKPEHTKEIVKGTRVSGVQDPSFALMATEFQSFSFYTDIIKVNNKNYVNPISRGTLNRYLFLIKDTLYEGRDTVFVLTFQPRKGKNFDALKGLLYINTHGFAIENVIAEPAEAEVFRGKTQFATGIKIQQKYERQGEVWFPTQLNADLSIKTGIDSSRNMTILGISRSYIKNIQINPVLKNSEFDQVALDYEKDAAHRDSSFWIKYRADTLSRKEKNTYVRLDSIGKKYKLDQKLNFLGYLATGVIPWGKISFDLNRILGINDFEGLRLGAGIHTNDRFSEFVTVGGYAAYGFGDGLPKYGYDGTLHLNKHRELDLNAAYYKDVSEMGGLYFYNNESSFLSNDNVREYFVSRMDRVENREVSLSFRALTYANVKLSFSNYTKNSTGGYSYLDILGNGLSQYTFTTGKIAFRYAYAERYIKMFNHLMADEARYPVLWGQYTRGLSGVMNGMFSFNKLDVKIEHSFFIKGLGAPSFQLAGGIVDRTLPLSELYAGRSSLPENGFASIRVMNTFQAMHMNEFYSDRYASLCLSNNFGKLLFRGTGGFQPELEWANNVLFGSMNAQQRHEGIAFNTPSKGYFETGLCLNNLVKTSFYGYGVGVFYRYGPYAYAQQPKNFALLLSYSISL